jgi:hypothetical protein
LLSYGIFHFPLCSVPCQSVWLASLQIILSASMLPCLSYIPRIFCGFLSIPSWHVPNTLLQSLLLSSFRFSILSQGTVSFICQFVYMFSLNFYGEGCHSNVDEDFSDIMLCRLECQYQSTWHLFPEN